MKIITSVYSMLIWCGYVLQNDHHPSISQCFILPHTYCFFFVIRTFKIYTPSNIHTHNTVLLPVITLWYIRSPEIVNKSTFLDHYTSNERLPGFWEKMFPAFKTDKTLGELYLKEVEKAFTTASFLRKCSEKREVRGL